MSFAAALDVPGPSGHAANRWVAMIHGGPAGLREALRASWICAGLMAIAACSADGFSRFELDAGSPHADASIVRGTGGQVESGGSGGSGGSIAIGGGAGSGGVVGTGGGAQSGGVSGAATGGRAAASGGSPGTGGFGSISGSGGARVAGSGGSGSGGSRTGGSGSAGSGGSSSGGSGTGGASTGGSSTGGSSSGGSASGGASAGDGTRYGFENTTQSWSSAVGSAAFAGIMRSTGQHYLGASALAGLINRASSAPSSDIYILEVEPPVPAVAPGTTVTFHVFVPTGAGIGSVQPYVLEAGSFRFTGTQVMAANLTRDGWTTIKVVVPANASPGSIMRMGVQFKPSSGSWSDVVYLDSVDW